MKFILLLVMVLFSCGGIDPKKELSGDAKDISVVGKAILDNIIFAGEDTDTNVTQNVGFNLEKDGVVINWKTSGADANVLSILGSNGVIKRFDKDYNTRVDFSLSKGTSSNSGSLRLNVKAKDLTKVNSLAITPAINYMVLHSSQIFTVGVYPDTALDQTLVMTVDPLGIATLDSATKTITANIIGEFKLKVVNDSSGVSDEITITVGSVAVVPVTSVSFVASAGELDQVSSMELSATVEPVNASNKTIVYSLVGETYGSFINPKTGILTAGLAQAPEGQTIVTVRATADGKSAEKEIIIMLVEIKGDGYGVAFGSKNLRYIQEKFDTQLLELDSEVNRSLKITAWKGDRVNAKLVLWTGSTEQEVSVTTADARSDGSAGLIEKEHIKASYLNYVKSSRVVKYIAPSNYYADVLYEDASKSRVIEPENFQPVWITFDIPSDENNAIFTTSLTVRIGLSRWVLPVEIAVLNLVVPDYANRKFDLQAWIHPQATAHYYSGCFPDAGYALLSGQDEANNSVHKCSEPSGIELWSDKHFRFYGPVLEELYKSGQRTTVTNITRDPWPNGWARIAGDLNDHQTYYAYDDMIKWTKKADGTWEWDYTNFEKFVRFSFSKGLDKNLELFGVLPWVANSANVGELIYFDEADGKEKRLGLTSFAGDWKTLWIAFFTDFIPWLDSQFVDLSGIGKTWYDVTRIAVDERNIDQLSHVNPILEDLKPVGKNRLRTSAAGANYHNAVNATIEYFAYHMGQTQLLYNRVSDDIFKTHVADRKASGLFTALYTSTECYPGHFTNSTPAENSFIGWYAAKVGAEGYLKWAIDSWNNARNREDMTPDYANECTDNKIFESGDTYQIYPGDKDAATPFIRSSVRHELMKEGILYYEKIQVLKGMGATGEIDALLNTIVRPTRVGVLDGTGGIQATDYRNDNNLKSFSDITERLEQGFSVISKKYSN